MWNTPKERWPALIRLCIDLWTELNPGWNVEVVDQVGARSLLGDDVKTEIFDVMKVQHQSDLVRTKLLSTRGGIWVDASCLPHMPVEEWIAPFEDGDYSFIPTFTPGQLSSNWFMISQEGGLLMSKQYASLLKYWRTPKFDLPQDERSISIIAANWREFVSDFAAHELRVAPYFLWHYLFSLLVETDDDFAACFRQQNHLSVSGDCGTLGRLLVQNYTSQISNDPITEEVRAFLMATDAQLSKLNHHSVELGYPISGFGRCIRERAAHCGK